MTKINFEDEYPFTLILLDTKRKFVHISHEEVFFVLREMANPGEDFEIKED